jgi:hypothetical protein
MGAVGGVPTSEPDTNQNLPEMTTEKKSIFSSGDPFGITSIESHEDVLLATQMIKGNIQIPFRPEGLTKNVPLERDLKVTRGFVRLAGGIGQKIIGYLEEGMPRLNKHEVRNLLEQAGFQYMAEHVCGSVNNILTTHLDQKYSILSREVDSWPDFKKAVDSFQKKFEADFTVQTGNLIKLRNDMDLWIKAAERRIKGLENETAISNQKLVTMERANVSLEARLVKVEQQMNFFLQADTVQKVTDLESSRDKHFGFLVDLESSRTTGNQNMAILQKNQGANKVHMTQRLSGMDMFNTNLKALVNKNNKTHYMW